MKRRRFLLASAALAAATHTPAQSRDVALYQGFSILTRKLATEERERADLLVDPPIPEHHDMEPATIKAIIDAGERAANEALPALAKLFAR